MRASSTTIVLVAVTLAGVAASSLVLAGGFYYSRSPTGGLPKIALPPGCSRPAGGFLVVMSQWGYNFSILEGAGFSRPWPVINVTQGSSVNITVCNADTVQAHGFQIDYYYDSKVVGLAPGQVLDVTFVATKAGTFQIYCDIFCTIHQFMQFGQLRVAP